MIRLILFIIMRILHMDAIIEAYGFSLGLNNEQLDFYRALGQKDFEKIEELLTKFDIEDLYHENDDELIYNLSDDATKIVMEMVIRCESARASSAKDKFNIASNYADDDYELLKEYLGGDNDTAGTLEILCELINCSIYNDEYCCKILTIAREHDYEFDIDVECEPIWHNRRHTLLMNFLSVNYWPWLTLKCVITISKDGFKTVCPAQTFPSIDCVQHFDSGRDLIMVANFMIYYRHPQQINANIVACLEEINDYYVGIHDEFGQMFVAIFRNDCHCVKNFMSQLDYNDERIKIFLETCFAFAYINRVTHEKICDLFMLYFCDTKLSPFIVDMACINKSYDLFDDYINSFGLDTVGFILFSHYCNYKDPLIAQMLLLHNIDISKILASKSILLVNMLCKCEVTPFVTADPDDDEPASLFLLLPILYSADLMDAFFDLVPVINRDADYVLKYIINNVHNITQILRMKPNSCQLNQSYITLINYLISKLFDENIPNLIWESPVELIIMLAIEKEKEASDGEPKIVQIAKECAEKMTTSDICELISRVNKISYVYNIHKIMKFIFDNNGVDARELLENILEHNKGEASSLHLPYLFEELDKYYTQDLFDFLFVGGCPCAQFVINILDTNPHIKLNVAAIPKTVTESMLMELLVGLSNADNADAQFYDEIFSYCVERYFFKIIFFLIETYNVQISWQHMINICNCWIGLGHANASVSASEKCANIQHLATIFKQQLHEGQVPTCDVSKLKFKNCAGLCLYNFIIVCS